MDLNVLNGFSTPELYMDDISQENEIDGFKSLKTNPDKPVKQKRTRSRLYSLYLADVAKKLDFDEFCDVEHNNIN